MNSANKKKFLHLHYIIYPIHIHPRLDIVNLDKIPSWDFTEILCLDSWIYIVNKRSLMGSFTISSLGCILIYN